MFLIYAACGLVSTQKWKGGEEMLLKTPIQFWDLISDLQTFTGFKHFVSYPTTLALSV